MNYGISTLAAIALLATGSHGAKADGLVATAPTVHVAVKDGKAIEIYADF